MNVLNGSTPTITATPTHQPAAAQGPSGICAAWTPRRSWSGNGSDELIDLILRLFRPGPRRGGMARSSTAPPPLACTSFYGATNDMRVLRPIPRDGRFARGRGRHRGAVRDPMPSPAHLCSLASPNNPDGGMLPDDRAGAAAPRCPCWWCWMRPMSSLAAASRVKLGGRAGQPDRTAHL
jgi:histidinol-phosphate/aromatic aminotransferase/cobyric acid decarboxylase-like protein